MITYAQAAELTARRPVKKIDHNTTITRESDGDYVIRLHGNPIIIIHPGSTWTVDSCGWRTVTTKGRINAYSPASVHQKSGEWFLRDGTRFRDLMRVDQFGLPVEEPATV